MRYIKIISLAAVAAIAAMALAATASATTVTSPKGELYTGGLVAQSGEITVHGVATYSCGESKAEGQVTQHGSSVTATGSLTKWTLAQCSTHVAVLKLGTVTIHAQEETPGRATVTVSGTQVTSQSTSLGMSCLYETNETDLGVLTDTSVTGGQAVLDINSALIPRTGHSIFCGSSGTLTGSYTITTPSALYID